MQSILLDLLWHSYRDVVFSFFHQVTSLRQSCYIRNNVSGISIYALVSNDKYATVQMQIAIAAKPPFELISK